MSITLAELNALPVERAVSLFASCCGSRRWVTAMVGGRPYASADELTFIADHVWWSLGADDWRDAFAHHPRIGEQATATAATATSLAWSASEQAGVGTAGDDVRAELSKMNAAYERKFGFTYIVRAAGRSPDDMLAIARRRLTNDPVAELRVAAEQQGEITQLRLGKLLEGEATP